MFRIQLKKIRERNFKSQKAFADAIGVSQSTVGNWESGTREPSLKVILKIARTLDVTVDELLGNTNAKPPRLNPLCKSFGGWAGDRLRSARTERGYSEAKMAAELEIDVEDYLRLESNETEPSFDIMLRLADIFGYKLDYMCRRMMKLEGADHPYHGSEHLLLRKFRSLDNKSQSAVWALLNNLYDSQSGDKASAPAKQA